MSEQVLNDQALLEMADQLKKTYDEITFKLDKITLENLELKKHLISAYGFIRVLDMMATNSYDIQPEILILIETLRAYLSDYMDDNIFNITLQN
tara:strand:+ start:1700 stop:1981 length:282 start_codon:yes stop_codon:yes gene_type:complete